MHIRFSGSYLSFHLFWYSVRTQEKLLFRISFIPAVYNEKTLLCTFFLFHEILVIFLYILNTLLVPWGSHDKAKPFYTKSEKRKRMKEISILRSVVGLLIVGTVSIIESMVNFCGFTGGPTEVCHQYCDSGQCTKKVLMSLFYRIERRYNYE